MKLFYIISLKWTFAEKYEKEGHVIFWRPNASGYTDDIRAAGRYTEAQAEAATAGLGANEVQLLEVVTPPSSAEYGVALEPTQ